MFLSFYLKKKKSSEAMEELSVEDPTQLLEAASEFAYHPGVQTDASAKLFLDRFPLPVIINALQTKADVPNLEKSLVACLERVFKTKYGSSLIPHYMPFVQVGLGADSPKIRCLACKTVTCLLENVNESDFSTARLLIDDNVYPLLLDCLINGDEQTANASMDAITKLASFPEGMEIIFPANDDDATHLGNLASKCSSLGRVRIMALVVKLFSVSRSVASLIYDSKLLSLLESEVHNSNDTLATLNVLELMYELVEIEHGSEFLPRASFLQLLSSMIRNTSVSPLIRSRATMITGRLLSKENIYSLVDESYAKIVISTIDETLGSSASQDSNQCELALEALGQIGSSKQGAILLLCSSPPAARHVIQAAFDPHVRAKQLAALHALGNIAGETRPENTILLNNDAEENMRDLVYQTAARSSKLTPSGLLLSVLQQDSEIRLAGYRVIAGLVVRPWCLMEICSKQEIINIVTDPSTETTKIGMEGRYNCCKAIHRGIFSSTKFTSDYALSGITTKLQEAMRNGPYFSRKNIELQPVVMTAERF